MSAPDFDWFDHERDPPPPMPPVPPTDANEPNALSNKLAAVTARALDRLDEVLSLPLDANNGNSLRALNSGINSAISAQLKADEMRLRPRGDPDIMPRLIQLMKEEREKMKILTEEWSLNNEDALKR
jgi:hypothetical protein